MPTLRAFSSGEFRACVETRFAEKKTTLAYYRVNLKHLEEDGPLTSSHPGAALLRPNPDGLVRRVLNESETAKLSDRAPEGRNQVLLRLLHMSGVRVSELTQLKWCDLLPRGEAGQISVIGKGGKTRAVLLKPKTWSLLLALKAGASAVDPVFSSQKGGRLDASRIRRIVYAAAAAASLPQKVSTPSLRHAHASHALDRGAPIHLVQATRGHTSVSTTGRYLHAHPTDSSACYLPD